MNIALVFLVFQSIILAASLLFYRRDQRSTRLWIGIYFVLLGIYFLGLYVHRIYAFSAWFIFQNFALLVALLINPVFYIAWRKLNGHFSLSAKKILLHITPFLVVLLLVAFLGLSKGIYFKSVSHLIIKIILGIKFLFHFQWIVYLMAIIKKLFDSKDPEWTEKQWKINAGGVLLGSYVLGYFLHVVELYSYYSSLGTLNIPYIFPFHSNLLILFIFITTNLLLFKSLDHQKVACNAVSTIVPNSDELENSRKEFHRISATIEKERLFTQSDLTLSGVAEKTGIKERAISSLINTVADKGFNEFINELRVREAQRLLCESNKSVKEIQFEVGFKSKTTFFDSFRKMTNRTPKEFRNEHGKK